MDKSQEWLDKHYASIGGTAASVVMNRSPYTDRRELWEVMTGQSDPPDLSGNDDVHRGELLEPIAIEALAEKLQETIQPHDQDDFVTCEEVPFAHALPDAWQGEKPWEIKVPRSHTFARIQRQGLPEEWLIQNQHNLAVLREAGRTEATAMGLAVMNPDTCRVATWDVELDGSVVDTLWQAESEFMACVSEKIEPELVTPPPLDLPDLAKGEMTSVDTPQLRAAAEYYLAIKEMYTDAGGELEQAKLGLLDQATGFSVFEIPQLLRCYHREQGGAKRHDKKLALKHLNQVALILTPLIELEKPGPGGVGAIPDFDKMLEQISKWHAAYTQAEGYINVAAPTRPFRAYDLRQKGT